MGQCCGVWDKIWYLHMKLAALVDWKEDARTLDNRYIYRKCLRCTQLCIIDDITRHYYWAFSCQNAANHVTFFVICTKVLFGCYIKNIEKFTPLMLIFTPLFGGSKVLTSLDIRNVFFMRTKHNIYIIIYI